MAGAGCNRRDPITRGGDFKIIRKQVLRNLSDWTLIEHTWHRSGCERRLGGWIRGRAWQRAHFDRRQGELNLCAIIVRDATGADEVAAGLN